MTYITAVGACASAFTTFALIPQLIILVRKKSAKNVSLTMLIVLLVGLILWIYYGALRSDPVIIISNSLAAVVNIATGALTIHYSSIHKPVRASNTRRISDDL